MTSLVTGRTAVAVMAAIELSVMVEMASPIETRQATHAATYKPIRPSLPRPAARDTVEPDNSVTGPTGNRMKPVTSAVALIVATEATQNVTEVAYLTIRSRV